MEAQLKVRDLQVGFDVFKGHVDVVKLDELSIGRGESYGLVGESGAGKTVLALTLLGLLPQPPAVIHASEMRLGGVDLINMSPKELRAIRGRHIAMIFQDPMSALDPVYSVRAQMSEVICRRAGVDRAEAFERILKYMHLVELPDPETIVHKYPHQLSGGQRQRLIIALALSCGADFLIADEPTRNLDVTVQASILKTMYRLRQELEVSMLFIANSLALVSAMCDRVGILMRGRLVETGTARDIVEEPMHPYTLDLLHAVPRKGEALVDNGVGLTDVDASRSACCHYRRCRSRGPACENTEALAMLPVSETHAVACPKAAAASPAVLAEAALGLASAPAATGYRVVQHQSRRGDT
jgi:oligopeptide/dipeptide ABC transporter ATP-binding protein